MDNLILDSSVIQPVDLEMAIVEQHKEKSGLTPERAEFQFLSIAKKLHRYGSHLFAVMVS